MVEDIGYCMKCKKKQKFVDPKPYTMKNGRKATTGHCGKCDTKMFKINKSLTTKSKKK